MDHRVSKDMISSGMTPSGKKSQADLGKTQYGSAPSPSRLMDAYQSMYQDKKEETLNEKMEDQSGSQDFVNRNIAGAKGQSKRTPEKTGRSQEEIKKSVDQSIQKGQERAEKREKLKGIMSKYGESVDLLAAYYAVYEHHQKDKDGNTIPHEDEINEGLPLAPIATGLKAFKTSKFATTATKAFKRVKKIADNPAVQYQAMGAMENQKRKPQGETGAISASADLFDIVKGQLLDEGLSEEEIRDIMLSLTPDEIMEELSDIVKRNDAINKAKAMERAKQNQVPQKIRDASKRQMKAGTPREDPNNPYTTQDKKDIINYNKDK